MEKFSYALEFYKNNIFSLNNVKLFKYKVKEAEEIEKYFNQVIPNKEYLRKYIIRSYLFDRKIRGLRRVAYIKGLILAESYIDFNDLIEFSDYIGESLLTEPKMSLWKYNGYLKKMNDEGTNENDNENKIMAYVLPDTMSYENYEDEESDEELSNSNEFSELNEKSLNIINEIIENIQNNFEYSEEEYILVHPKEKLIQFINSKQEYIDETIKVKKIDEEEVSMVKKGMNDWIDYILSSMKDVYEIKEYSLRFNDENISKYI